MRLAEANTAYKQGLRTTILCQGGKYTVPVSEVGECQKFKVQKMCIWKDQKGLGVIVTVLNTCDQPASSGTFFVLFFVFLIYVFQSLLS